ncbi:MAG: CheR family methyltransferase [Prosthecobacter sp.]
MTSEPASATLQAGLLHDPQLWVLKAWIIQHTGLSYYSERDADLVQALERVFAFKGELGCAARLLKRLQSNPQELDALVEQLTIGETFFFRHLEMFHALRDHVFPDVLRRRAASRTLRIWSAGCSIGAEPYSISILLRELLGAQFRHWSIHILGTDINRKFLRMAEEGAYEPWTLRGMPPHVLARSFIKDQAVKKWRISDRCREGVAFRSHNLACDPLPDPLHDLVNFDLIICRNVMIYFDQPAIQRLARQFYDTLRPGGWLAVGHAEPHTSTFRMFRTVNATGAVLYQRPTAEHGHVVLGDPVPPMPAPATGLFPPPPPAPNAQRPWQPAVLNLDLPAEVPTSTSLSMPHAKAQPQPQKHGAAHEDPLAEITRLADAGDLKAALQACDALILREPLHAGAYYYHGMILAQHAEWAAAERSLRRCLYLERNLALAHFYLGLVLERLGQPARKHYANAQDLLAGQPEHALVPLGQGLTVREFRSLLTTPEPPPATSAPRP